ncbi:hypothetical protein L218DRAFT_1004475 [Marasmius fiardii PR-910]|nr:hypothetical protein L218DRAFT_1004475 [Marasmius fiardii PR-910]
MSTARSAYPSPLHHSIGEGEPSDDPFNNPDYFRDNVSVLSYLSLATEDSPH